jgi:outer membrane protein assembly factor BamB|tara:strand:+ start:1059 stop:2360 length:1302 start_codon:yes stop_codon:yes gene_type:complete
MTTHARNATLALLLLSSVHAADWPQFMGPNQNNSVLDETIAAALPAGGPPLVWEVDVSVGFGGAAIVGDEVFHIDRVDQAADVVFCRDLKTGKTKWSWKHDIPGRISHPGSRGVPTVTADAVYATSGYGHIYCIDRKTHKARWIVNPTERFETEPPRFGYSIHPIIQGDLCFIAPTSSKVGLAALDIKTGKTVWKSEPFGSSHSSPSLVSLLGKKILTMPGDINREKLVLLGVDPNSGKTLFKFSEDMGSGIFNAIPNLAVLSKDTAIYTVGYGRGTRLLKFAEKDGKITVTKTAQPPYGAKFHIPLLIDGKLYMTADGGRRRRGAATGKNQPTASGLVSLSPDGMTHWFTGNKPGFNGGAIINVGGLIVSQDGDTGELRLIKPGKKYHELAKAKVFTKETGKELWAPLAFSNGKLVMRSQNQLICVDLSPER